MSITLSIHPAIVQEVREWAEANGTSLNQYVRDCLAAKAAEIEQQRSARADRFLAFARANLAHAPKEWRFNRQRDGERNLEAFG